MINIPIFKRKKEELIQLERLHPPPKPRLFKHIGCKIEIAIIEEKMKIGGYKKYSDLIRDAIANFHENGLEEKILQLTHMVTEISDKIFKIYKRILSGLTFNERIIVEKGDGILPNRKGGQEQLTPEEKEKQSSMLKLAMEVKKIVEEVGDVTKILKPVPEEELKKDRPKTDQLSFLKFKNK